jgi:hypothetical protein
LPQTNAIFGRAGRRAAHYVYTTRLANDGLTGRITYKDPCAAKGEKGTLVELRIGAGNNGQGAQQTIFPGSTHESGEPIEWEPGKNGDPTFVEGDELHAAVKRIAAAALLAR